MERRRTSPCSFSETTERDRPNCMVARVIRLHRRVPSKISLVLRQEDPLSPMLFVLTMEAINAMICKADHTKLFTSLHSTKIKYRASLYADDLVIFLAPARRDLAAMKAILDTFAAASGLHTNVQKCQFTPIRCTQEQIDEVLSIFSCQLVHFPCKYLGIPLSIYKLKKHELQYLVDKVADKLPTWKGKLMSRAGRNTLTKVTLSAIPTHTAIALELSPWVISSINKIQKAFLWEGSDVVHAGKCLVAWSKVTRSQELGGLGIIDLATFGYALRMRWEWLSRTDDSRTWISLPSRTEKIIKALFDISVTVEVGNGAKTKFWSDRWLNGVAIESFAPEVCAAVPKRTRNMRTVQDALQQNQWKSDMQSALSTEGFYQLLDLDDRLQTIHLQPTIQDKFIWRWSSNQQYSASSAYNVLFTGQCGIPGAKELSKTRAPQRVKMFFWLALLGRCWTSDRLQRHNMRNNGPCALCNQEIETIEHLILGCVYSREVWFRLLLKMNLHQLTPNTQAAVSDWWTQARKRVDKESRKGFDTFVLLCSWML